VECAPWAGDYNVIDHLSNRMKTLSAFVQDSATTCDGVTGIESRSTS
jgi:hypothetical protein